MSTPFLGQIMLAGFNFAPKSFAACNGQLLPINQNQALFALLGTSYGGDGRVTFALPDLRGRTPLGYASSADAGWQTLPFSIGQAGGTETVTLLAGNLPAHGHSMNASSSAGTSRTPTNRVFASSTNSTTPAALYGPDSGTTVALNAQSVVPSGGNQPHSNMQPYTAINFCIALAGVFPSQA